MTKKHRVPRTHRTRIDPFASVWETVCQQLAAAPERTAKSLFDELQQTYPGVYRDTQLRTLQRHVKDWRARAILTFEDQWISEDRLSEPRPPQLIGVVCDTLSALYLPESGASLAVGT